MPKCSNCNKEIDEGTLILHEVHCTRFLYVCPQCGEAVPKTKKQEHEKKVHVKIKCNYCSLEFDKDMLALHKTLCEKKPSPCDFCGAVLELSELNEHQETCGNRTEKCDVCGKSITMKDMPDHLVICLEMQEEESSDQLNKRKPSTKQSKKKGKK